MSTHIETKGTMLCHCKDGCMVNDQSFYAMTAIKINIICFDTCNLLFKYSYNISIWELPLKTEKFFKLMAALMACSNFPRFLRIHKPALLFYLYQFHRYLINLIFKKWMIYVINIYGKCVTNTRISCCFTPFVKFFFFPFVRFLKCSSLKFYNQI